MQFKMKTLVAAAAFVVSGSAFAAIDAYGTGNGELFFNVYDPTTKTSYVRDLFALASDASMGTFKMNDFLPTGAAAGGNPAPGGVFTNNPGYVEQFGKSFKWTFNLGQFQDLAGANAAGWKWNVVAGDKTGATLQKDQVRYLTTSRDTKTNVEKTTTSKMGNFSTTESFITTVNGALPGADDGGTFSQAANGAGYFGQGFGDKWLVNLFVDSTAKLGEKQNFYYMTGNTSGSLKALVTQYGNSKGAASWEFKAGTLPGQYDLIYSAPVPEPETWAMFAAGLVVVGAIARRRMV